jgi:hypothetical protein
MTKDVPATETPEGGRATREPRGGTTARPCGLAWTTDRNTSEVMD